MKAARNSVGVWLYIGDDADLLSELASRGFAIMEYVEPRKSRTYSEDEVINFFAL